MNRIALLLLLLLPTLTGSFSQEDTSRFSFFPSNTQFTPLSANHEEPRMGIQQDFGSSQMTVGVGNLTDIIQYARGEDTVRWGVDFFVYALSDDYRGYRLKIAAADGFFGMHVSYTNGSPWSFRFRALHYSAHLVDGHFDSDRLTWKDGLIPFPFSRNYGELVAARECPLPPFAVRWYAGFSYSVFNKPNEIKRFTSLLGGEARTGTRPVLYAAYNLSLIGVPRYNGNNTIEVGVKFGSWYGRGARLFLAYYNGLDWFGEYYNQRKEALSAGFTFDFW